MVEVSISMMVVVSFAAGFFIGGFGGVIGFIFIGGIIGSLRG